MSNAPNNTDNAETGIKKKEDIVPFLGVRRKWVGIALYLFSISMVAYSFFACRYYLARGWKGYETARAIVADMADFIPTAIWITILLFIGVDLIMIFYKLVKEHFEARDRKRLAEAEARGIKIGEARGEARGIQTERQEWVDWEARRTAAEAAGESFNEPSPAEKRAAQEQDSEAEA